MELEFNEGRLYHLINQLEFLSKVKKGDKISLKSNLVISNDLWYGPIIRYLLDENRQQNIREIEELHDKVQSIIREISYKSNIPINKILYYLKKLDKSLEGSLTGISNMTITYKEDIPINIKLNNLIQKYKELRISIKIYQGFFTSSTQVPIVATQNNSNKSITTSYSAPSKVGNYNEMFSQFSNESKIKNNFDPSDLGIDNKQQEKSYDLLNDEVDRIDKVEVDTKEDSGYNTIYYSTDQITDIMQ
jgi:hypothetical protein